MTERVLTPLAPPAAAEDPGLLTADEHLAVDDAGKLWNLLCRIVGDGPSRRGDLEELRHLIHGIQRAVLKQAAARAYPDRYRLLGETIASAAAASGSAVETTTRPAVAASPARTAPVEYLGQGPEPDRASEAADPSVGWAAPDRPCGSCERLREEAKASARAAGLVSARPGDTPGQVEPDDAQPQPIDVQAESGAAYRCESCGSSPRWRMDRRGDAAVTWACDCHTVVVLERLQRAGEGTEVVVRRAKEQP